MPIAKTATTLPTSPLDAPHADRVKHATVVAVPTREQSTPETTSLDESLENPYDNVACTD